MVIDDATDEEVRCDGQGERAHEVLNHAGGGDDRLAPQPAHAHGAEVASVAVPAPPNTLLHEAAERVRKYRPRPRVHLIAGLPSFPQDEPCQAPVVAGNA